MITLYGYAASHRAVREMKGRLAARGHRGQIFEVLEQPDRARPSQHKVPDEGHAWPQRFRSAATTIAGIELMHRIRKGQFNLATLDVKDTTPPTIWNTVLSAQ